MSGHDGDERPPPRRAGRTPAERAGATPLDPEKLKAANAGMPVVQRQREIVGQIPMEDDAAAEPVVRRRRSSASATRPRGPARPGRWFLAAAVAALLGVALVAFGWFSEDDVVIAESVPPELVVATPVLSARRVPELVSRPVASRNLAAAVDPVLAQAPPDTCLQARAGSSAVVSRNETASLVPASNMKLVSAAAALELLGPDTRLSTRFVTDGAPTDGTVVRGNLYMIGGGDPLLSTSTYLSQLPNGLQPSTDLADVADRIAAAGIREITGSVVGDESRYDMVRTIDAWPERYLSQGQVAPLSALLVDDAWSPSTGAGNDPAVHAATVLTELLRERGITVAGAPSAGVAPDGAPTLTEVESLTVAELVDEALRFSDNTTVELLVKEMGLQASGEGSTAAGLEAVRGWVDDAGLPAEGLVLDDGSGLSEQNRVTCSLLAELLADEGAEGTVANGLARPGEPGTLDDRLLDPDLQGRVRAKTGTLRPVTALSGWLRTVPERDLAFAFVINTPGGSVTEADLALQGTLLEAMLGYPDSPPLEELSPGEPVAPEA